MSGINLSPKRSFAYPGTRLIFVDESSFAYCFGSAVRITHLLPDKGDGDGECLWGENEWAGTSAVAANWRSGQLAVCPAGRINPAIHLYSYPGMELRGTLVGSTDLRYVDVSLSRDGKRVAAFGNRTDHRATVWNVSKAAGNGEELKGEKVVEATLPGDMSFLSFNPADSDQLCIGGPSGLYFWRIDNLVDTWVISPTKAKAPYPPGKGNQWIIGEDNNDDGAPTRKSQFISTADGGLPKAKHSAGTAGATEIDQLKNLVMMGDGKHDSFTCHCWGLENSLWAVNEQGQLACFDANTGKCSTCKTLNRASESTGGSWKAVGLLVTTSHIVVTGCDGSIDWLTLPSESGKDLEVEFSIQLQEEDCSPCPAVAMACSPLYDKIVVGSSNGSLHSIFLDIERHTGGSGLPASGVNTLRTFHRGKVLSVACLRPLCKNIGEVPGGILVTGGEDGFVRAWTADRGKPCGKIQFSAFSNPEEFSAFMEKGRRVSIFDRNEALEGKGPVTNSIGDVPIPVCAVAPCKTQPLLAVGLCHGMVHILFVKQTSAYDVEMTTLWRERLFRGSVSQLCFHPTKSLLAVASTDDRTVRVVNFHSASGDFSVCTVGVAPPGQGGGVNGLMWRGNDIIFSTEDCLLCALPVKPERRARPNRVDPLMWAFRTPTSLYGMRPHPQIQDGPFFAVSADMRVLQVLPALPEKGMPSTLDEGQQKLLSPLDTLQAHQKGTAVMAASPDGRFMATGGADGLVCLWMVYESQVELLNSALVHAGPVISLAFAANSAQLFTTSLDGTVFGLALEGLQEGSGPQPSRMTSTLEGLACRKAEKQQSPDVVIESLDVETWQSTKAETRDISTMEPDAAGKAQRRVVGEFKARLARIVERNEMLPALEKMDRSEFVVDLAGRDRKVSANEASAKKLRNDINRANLSEDIIASRIKVTCWDSMEVQKAEVWSMQPDDAFVENFAIRRRSKEELALIQKVKQLRALELRDIRRGTYSASKAWSGLLDEVPPDISWVVSDGRLTPAVDVVQALRDEAAGGDTINNTRGSGVNGKGGGAEDASQARGNRSLKENDTSDEEGEDVITALEEGDESDPTYLLYPSLALRTPRQKRTQIMLLGEIVVDAQRAFNRHFDRLHSAKEDYVDKARDTRDGTAATTTSH